MNPSRRFSSLWIYLRSHRIARALPFWIAALLVGFAATLYAQLFYYISHASAELFARLPWLIFLLAPTAFLAGSFLVQRFAPSAAGSGIPQVLAAIDLDPITQQEEISRLLKLKVALIKVLSSICCLVGGGAIGREGPTLQISACIFRWVGGQAKKIWPESENHSWIIAGGAAGIASAFNTPLGGIVYAIEELSSVHFQKFKMTALSAVIVSGVVAQAILGPYLYLGYPVIGPVTLSIFPIAILVGVLSGGLGSIFGSCLFYTSTSLKARFAGSRSLWIPLGCGLLLAAIYYFVDPRAIGPGSDINSDLLSGGADHSGVILVLVRFVSSLLSYVSGCAGGIFAPSLAIGASVGAELSQFFASGHENLIILLGMIGFLTAVTHCPFTSLVLVIEMTDRHSAIFPMMLSALTAQSISKALSSASFYERMKKTYL